MKSYKSTLVFFITLFAIQSTTLGQQHPRIWVSEADKPQILANIQQHQWAADLKKQLEDKVNPWSSRHRNNPQFLLSRIPRTWGGENPTDADITKANATRPFLATGKAPVPTLHRSDDKSVIGTPGADYDYPGLENLPPYNNHPYFGMDLKIKGANRTEFVTYSGPVIRRANTEILILGVDASVLYYLTGKTEYAQLAVDILHAYVEPLHYMNTFNTEKNVNSGIVVVNFLRDARIIYPMLPLIYDMTHDFLQKPNTLIFDAVSQSYISFNDAIAQTVFIKLANTILEKGNNGNNWPILEGYGALFNILAIKNTNKRNALFKAFYQEDNINHDPFLWSLGNFTSENLWPESLGYSFDVNNRMLNMMAIIDNNKNLLNVDVFAVSPRMLEGPFVYDNLTYPNGRALRFGDSSGVRFPTEVMYETVEYIARRKGLAEYEQRARQARGDFYKRSGKYSPKIGFESLGYTAPLKLLWGIDPDVDSPRSLKKGHTLYVSHAGVLMQRNDNTSDVKEHGLMYYTGGSSYVHAHGSGIDLELYGAGYVMGPDFGTGGYGRPVHGQYATRHASHNTVIVNGAAKWGKHWHSVMSPTVLLAVEPAPYEDPIAEDFAFSCQALNDQINAADQQRCVAMIRTSSESGYYVDLFRSASKGEDKFSDYLYHNIGDSAELLGMDNRSIALKDTPNRYQTDIGDEAKQPGWRWFEDTKTSNPTNSTLKVRFNLDTVGRYLNAYLPGGSGDREISLAYGPATPKAADGYDRKKTPIMTIRRQGAAWKAPYVVVFEPAQTKSGNITNSQLIRSSGDTVGVIVTSVIGDATIKDFIFAHDSANQTYENGDIQFSGRFGLIRERSVGGETTIQLYIGDGASLSYKGETLKANSSKKGFLDSANTPTELALERFTFASAEGGTIDANTPVDIAYGADGQYIFSLNRTGSIQCLNSICRKDPIPGTRKQCYTRESKVGYSGGPTILPNTIEAEHYDYGGEGVSYSDKSSTNKGADETQFRVNDGVDIVTGNGGMALGYIGEGEWTEYTVRVQEDSTFTLSVVAAASIDTGAVMLDINGMPRMTLTLPNTGDKNVYQTASKHLDLPAGEHIIRMNFQGGDFHIDKLIFEKQ